MICCFLGAIVFLDLFDLFIWLFDKPKTKIKKKIKKPPIKKVDPPKKIITFTDYVDFPE